MTTAWPILRRNYGTNPTARDSDMDLIDDIVEVANNPLRCLPVWESSATNRCCKHLPHTGPFSGVDRSWFLMDMDGDGLLNEAIRLGRRGRHARRFYSAIPMLPWHPTQPTFSNPSNASDGYGDWDEDGMNNLREYQVAQIFGEGNLVFLEVVRSSSSPVPVAV